MDMTLLTFIPNGFRKILAKKSILLLRFLQFYFNSHAILHMETRASEVELMANKNSRDFFRTGWNEPKLKPTSLGSSLTKECTTWTDIWKHEVPCYIMQSVLHCVCNIVVHIGSHEKTAHSPWRVQGLTAWYCLPFNISMLIVPYFSKPQAPPQP